jgi:hypothetical protein
MKLLNYQKAALAFILFSFCACTRYIDIYKTVWQNTNVVVDGKPAEWDVPLKFYDEKSRLQYTVSNDRENLYVCIRATDKQTQTKMFRAGMHLWVDTTGKNEHFIGITFPMPNALPKTNPIERERGTETEQLNNTMSRKFNSSYKEMELIGFKLPIKNGINSIQNEYGINIGISWDSSEIMTYEATIPFKTFYKESLSDADSSKKVAVSIVLNGIVIPQTIGGGGGGHGNGRGTGVPGDDNGMSGNRMPGSGGGMGGGMGGMGGGGMRNPGGGGIRATPQGSSYLSEPNSIKTIFQLSTKKRNIF